LTNLKNPDLLYVVGGLYGNTNALSQIAHLASLESTPPTIIFNGDFNFFNVSPSSFHSINSAVLNDPHNVATAGNVEREISSSSSYIGCGCSYPSFVGEAVVSRSDDIVSRLHETCRNSEHHKALGELPPYLKTVVGGKTVGVLHGDFHSLAGWSFAAEAMTPVDDDLHKALGVDGSFRVTSEEEVVEEFEEAGVDIVACTHTCLAFGQKVRRFGGFNSAIIPKATREDPNQKSLRITSFCHRKTLHHPSPFSPPLPVHFFKKQQRLRLVQFRFRRNVQLQVHHLWLHNPYILPSLSPLPLGRGRGSLQY
jgi:hypothetical protein